VKGLKEYVRHTDRYTIYVKMYSCKISAHPKCQFNERFSYWWWVQQPQLSWLHS